MRDPWFSLSFHLCDCHWCAETGEAVNDDRYKRLLDCVLIKSGAHGVEVICDWSLGMAEATDRESLMQATFSTASLQEGDALA